MNINNQIRKIAIIKYPVNAAGIFALYLASIITTIKAIDEGFIPIIDIQHSNSQ